MRKVNKMSKTKTTKNKNKGSLKCKSCEFYDKSADFCTEKEIENCSKQTNVNFSKCDDYLVRESLVMF